MMNINIQRQQIRRQIRKTRANLTALQQQQAENNITAQALQLVEQENAEHIALYLSFDGEISTQQLIHRLWALQKKGLFTRSSPLHGSPLIISSIYA